jgi:hypothetical protein
MRPKWKSRSFSLARQQRDNLRAEGLDKLITTSARRWPTPLPSLSENRHERV